MINMQRLRIKDKPTYAFCLSLCIFLTVNLHTEMYVINNEVMYKHYYAPSKFIRYIY